MKYFAGVKTVEELRKMYRVLLKKSHPDNGGNVKEMQEINSQYDDLFAILSEENKSDNQSIPKRKTNNLRLL